ncbi:hypothetical protein [Streptomyces sp. F-1]|uniref:hypothetical protein n=1 Tax=Streptomyces sp. F-1 TaxID=463642 RepID=UPI000A9AC063|nr:hypothetical protein [Streptomyces sp. F-1]
MDWTLKAARQGITDDVHLLLPLLSGTDPAPDELRALLAGPGTRRYDDLLQPVPWLTWVDTTGVGLRRCIDEMLKADTPGALLDDPPLWGGGSSS